MDNISITGDEEKYEQKGCFFFFFSQGYHVFRQMCDPVIGPLITALMFQRGYTGRIR